MAIVAEGSAPGSEGLAILKAQGCNACHSTDGSKIIGPSYLNLFGEQQIVIGMERKSLLQWTKNIFRKQFMIPIQKSSRDIQKALMQSYEGIISEDDIAKIIEYLKSLNE